MSEKDPVAGLMLEWFPDCSDTYRAELKRQVEQAFNERALLSIRKILSRDRELLAVLDDGEQEDK